MSKLYAFEIGQLVQHRRYGYRGVVASRDPECRASKSWYQNNQSQPERAQPWYHVLVHGSDHTTYAAETSLEEELGGEQVVHPLAKLIFESFHGGQYTIREGIRFPDFP